MRGIVEAYDNAESSTARRTVLSIVAPYITFSTLQLFIPGLSHYRFVDARMYHRRISAGQQVNVDPRVFHRFDVTQIQHFIDFITSDLICIDLPFGEKVLKLNDGTKLLVPDTIRNCDSSRIIDHYYQYCHESFPNFPVLGRSTLFKILDECKASTRKAIQGLNYFIANGTEAFDSLYDVVNCLLLDPGENRRLIDNLKRGKQYLKTDFKFNVSRLSRVGAHCIQHSLSDPLSDSLSTDCVDHEHDQICFSCSSLTQTFDDINDAVQNSAKGKEEKIRLKHKVHLAIQSIYSWKSHQLRVVNQDLGRDYILDLIGEDCVHLNMDFAMK